MKERPVLFSAPMIRAILAGAKTQTRRIVKPVGNDGGFVLCERADGSYWPHRSDDGESCFVTGRERDDEYLEEIPMRCPYGVRGDRLWVRETFCDDWHMDRGEVEYRADGELDSDMFDAGCTWRPSIHMPRWASRITLEVTGVRVQRLCDISESDAISEGVRQLRDGSECWVGREGPGSLVTPWPTARDAFRDLWQSINGLGSWGSNPLVWVVEFKRVGQ